MNPELKPWYLKLLYESLRMLPAKSVEIKKIFVHSINPSKYFMNYLDFAS